METSVLEPSSPSSGSFATRETPRWFLCPGATRDAQFSEVAHGTVIFARDFTSVAVRPFKLSYTECVQYEVHLLSPGSMQVGWCATPSALPFTATHGVGDSTVSVGVDGSRCCLLRLQEQPVPSLRWQCGDILSCYADFRRGVFEFALNGVVHCQTELPTRGWLSAHGVAAMQPGRAVEDAMLVYTVGLSLMGGECCVINLGEAPMRYPRLGYCSVLAQYMCAASVTTSGGSFTSSSGAGSASGTRDESTHPSQPEAGPGGGVCAEASLPAQCHICLGGTSLESLLSLLDANGQHELVGEVRRAAEAGLWVLARAMGQLTRRVSNLLLQFVSWFETDVQGRWRAFAMLVCLVLEELYGLPSAATMAASEGIRDTSEHVTGADAERATEMARLLLHTLRLLVPEEHFAVLPGLLITALQHRFYSNAIMRMDVLHVIHDLVHVPGIARVWLEHTPTFCSTALNLFFVPPPGEAQCAWLAAQLRSTAASQSADAAGNSGVRDDRVVAEARCRLRLLRPSCTAELLDAASATCWRLATSCVGCAAQDTSGNAAATAVLLRLMCEPPLRQDGLLLRAPRHALAYVSVSESFPGSYALHHPLLTVNALVSAFVQALPEDRLAALDEGSVTFRHMEPQQHAIGDDAMAAAAAAQTVDVAGQTTLRCGSLTWQSLACALCPQELFYMRPWTPGTELTPAAGSSPALQQDIRLGGPFHQLEQSFVRHGLAAQQAADTQSCVVTGVLDAAGQETMMSVDGRAFFVVLCAASTTFLRPLLAQLSNLRVTFLDTAAACVATDGEDASLQSGRDVCSAQVRAEATAPRTRARLELELLALLLTTLNHLHGDAWQARMTTLTAAAGAVLEYYWNASMPGVAAAHDTRCAPRAFLMLPLVILNAFLDSWLFLGVAEGKNSLLVARYPTLTLGFFDAVRRHDVAPVITRTYLYQAMASVAGFGPRDRLQVAQLLCRQEQHACLPRTQGAAVIAAAAAAVAASGGDDDEAAVPRSLPFLRSSILDCLDVYVHEDNFNDTLALNFLYSLAQEQTCLLPPPRLLEESFWWLQQLRREDEAAVPQAACLCAATGDTATDTVDGTTRMADELYLDSFCRAVRGVDMRRFLLPALTKSNRLLTQFTALGVVRDAPASSASTLEVYRNYYLKYTLLRKNLYLLDFFWHVLCLHDDGDEATGASTLGSPSGADTEVDHRTEAMRCALMDVILQAFLRIRFAAATTTKSTTTAHVAVGMVSDESAALLVPSDAVHELLQSQEHAGSDWCALRENVLLPTVMYVDGRGAEPRRHYCTNAPCTVIGLLAPLFSILHRVLVQYGTVIEHNPYLALTSELGRLVHNARQLLLHPAWWATPPPALCPHADAAAGQAVQHEFLPARSQDILRQLRRELDEVHEQLGLRGSSRRGHGAARAGAASQTCSPRVPHTAVVVALSGRLETASPGAAALAPPVTPPSLPPSAPQPRRPQRPDLDSEADELPREVHGTFRFFNVAAGEADETPARSHGATSGVAAPRTLSGALRGDRASGARLARPPAPHRLALHVGDSDHSDESSASHEKARLSAVHSARVAASVEDDEDGDNEESERQMGSQSEDDDTLCRICYERPVNVRFQPCGHGCCHLCLYRSRNEGFVAERAASVVLVGASTVAASSAQDSSALTTPTTAPLRALLARLSSAEDDTVANDLQDTVRSPIAAAMTERADASASLSQSVSVSHEVCFFCRAPISAVLRV